MAGQARGRKEGKKACGLLCPPRPGVLDKPEKKSIVRFPLPLHSIAASTINPKSPATLSFPQIPLSPPKLPPSLFIFRPPASSSSSSYFPRLLVLPKIAPSKVSPSIFIFLFPFLFPCVLVLQIRRKGSSCGRRRRDMAEVLRSNLCVPCATFSLSSSLSKQSPGLGFWPSPSSLRFQHSMASSSSIRTDFYGRPGGITETQSTARAFDNPQAFSVQAQSSPWLGKALKWWEKGLQPNMREIDSAEDLVYSLRDAGNQLVIIDFFSPGCGGCRTLHPKICQLAEMNPDVLFLQINYEKHKSMSYSLNVHVLPFFRFYRGAQGRLCSFSCTNATIKKFKDALAKHTTERCSLGPAKGLEESELLALATNKELSFSYPTGPNTSSRPVAPARPEETPCRAPSVKPSQEADGRELITATRW